MPVAAKVLSSVDVLHRLGNLCAEQDLGSLGRRLLSLADLVSGDLEALEAELACVTPRPNLVGKSAAHLLDLGGKRLRPLCVLLASRVGRGFSEAVVDMAVAVELVHNATLLHDDVVDLADHRRGRATARAVYGNAASVFAGDWLLIEALRRVARAGVDGTMEVLFDTIDEMIQAEALQLANRGRVDTDRETYFRVAEGKTAALFRWGMYAGGRAGGLAPAECRSLERFGLHLGVAFQVIDDLLDLTGETSETGKSLFSDLLEGKMTYPLIVALERDPELHVVVERILSLGGYHAPPRTLSDRVVSSLRATGAVEDSRQLARQRCHQAVESLQNLPDNRARAALETVAEATITRRR